jgi:hypothetical protein
MIEFDTEKHTGIVISEDLLSSVEEEGFTYLHCTYYTSPKYKYGWWVNIYLTSYLVDCASGEKLSMMDALQIPIAPARHYLKKKGDCLSFTLIFPMVPKTWSSFDFLETCGSRGGLSIKNISTNHSGVYKVMIR